MTRFATCRVVMLWNSFPSGNSNESGRSHPLCDPSSFKCLNPRAIVGTIRILTDSAARVLHAYAASKTPIVERQYYENHTFWDR